MTDDTYTPVHSEHMKWKEGHVMPSPLSPFTENSHWHTLGFGVEG